MRQRRRKTRGLGAPRVLSFLAALSVAGSAACGGSGGSGYPTDPSEGGSNAPGGARTPSITVVNSSYTPSATTVSRGTTVVWTWNTCNTGYGGETCTAHTVSFDDGPSSDVQESGSYSRLFASPGTYRYNCKVHGSSMSGTVTVE